MVVLTHSFLQTHSHKLSKQSPFLIGLLSCSSPKPFASCHLSVCLSGSPVSAYNTFYQTPTPLADWHTLPTLADKHWLWCRYYRQKSRERAGDLTLQWFTNEYTSREGEDA